MHNQLLWACKMTLLEQLNESQVLKESMTYNEKDKFEDFIKELALEEAKMIFLREDTWQNEQDAIRGMLQRLVTKRLKMHDQESRGPDWERKYRKYTTSIHRLRNKLDNNLKDRIAFRKANNEEILTKERLGRKLGLPAKIAIGVGIATLLAIAGYFIYKRFKDQCTKQCKTSTDPDCLKKCRQLAMRTSISKLQAAKSVCGDQKCKDKADKQIRKLQQKLAGLK